MSLRCAMGIHRWERTELRPMRCAVLGWDHKPTREWEKIYLCQRCNRRKKRRGWVVHEDHKLYPEYYNENGWPMDPRSRRPYPSAD